MKLLVVAKAPVPGEAKTRLAPAVGAEGAAELAAAALLDTLAAARAFGEPVVALTGDLRHAVRADEIRSALSGLVVVPQRGEGFDERLAAAHADAAGRDGGPVLQIGMDTPQATAALLRLCAAQLSGADAVLGPADDGGWWLLGVRRAAMAGALVGVPMSTPHTCRETRNALRRNGFRTTTGPGLRDVDTIEDARAVAAAAPGTRFAAALRNLPDRWLSAAGAR